jgi:hypothetical protein
MRSTVRGLARRYAVAWGYLIAVSAASAVYALLPRPDQAAVLRVASTNVHNLQADPVGCMIASAFFPAGSAGAWPLLIALALFGACRVLGNWRTAVVCTAGHVVGTLVSEGIVGYRVSHGSLPASARFITDVGPSYVVVAAIAVALLFGGWIVRAAAALDLAVLAFVGAIFSGLTRLDVAAVGHLTAIVTGALAGAVAMWQLRRAPRAPGAPPALAAAAPPAPAPPASAPAGPVPAAPAPAGPVPAGPYQPGPDQPGPYQPGPDQPGPDQAVPAAAGSRDSGSSGDGPRDPAAAAQPDDEPRDPDQAAQPRPSA